MSVLLSIVSASLRLLFAWSFAISLSVALLTIMPIVQYLGMHGLTVSEKKVYAVAPLAQTLPAKKRPRPKPDKPKPASQTPNQGPKSLGRSTLAMDLGIGGSGTGVAIGGAEAAGGQMVYAEGETDEDAVPLRQVAPRYPEEARKAGVSGLVRVLITIQEDGSVGEVRFLETPGDYGFETVVREALAQWRFQPAQVGGVPVRQKMEQPFQF